jgi:hypothetical protein
MRKTALMALAAAAVAVPTAAEAGGAPGAAFVLHPQEINAGKVLKVNGAPVGGCGAGSEVVVFSRAFATDDDEFRGIPAADARVRTSGRWTLHVRIRKSAEGNYRVGARCNGGSLGTRVLRVEEG